MSRIRLIALSVLAMFAVGAISASSASAEFTQTVNKCEGAGIATFCLEKTAGEGLKEASGSEKFTTKLEAGTESLLEVPSLELHIVCTATPGKGVVDQPSPLVTAPTFKETVIEFTGCSLLAPLAGKCKVKEPIITKTLVGEVLPTEPRHIVFKPAAGNTWWETTITNISGCPATTLGINPIKGKALALFLAEAETTDAVVQLLQFTHEDNSETKLEFGTNPTTFETEFEVEFELKWLWDTVLA
jgi:hypothetical protein